MNDFHHLKMILKTDTRVFPVYAVSRLVRSI